MTADQEPTADQAPLLRVVSGDPTPEELAALIAIVSAAAAGADDSAADEPAPSAWSAPAAMHRQPMPAPGPGAWVALGRRS